MTGLKVNGNVVVDKTVVKINGEILFLAMPFKSRIEDTTRHQVEELLKKK